MFVFHFPCIEKLKQVKHSRIVELLEIVNLFNVTSSILKMLITEPNK